MTAAQFTLPTEANKKLNIYKNKTTTVPRYWASVLKGNDSQVTENKYFEAHLSLASFMLRGQF